MVKSFSDKVTAPELNYILKHFDQGSKGYVSKSDFMSILSGEIRETATSGFQLSIEDIIKPLATRCLKYGVNMDKLFSKIDKSHNGRVSAEELAAGLLSKFQIKLQDDEIRGIKQYFQNKHKSTDIPKSAFVDLLKTTFEKKFDAAEARKALYDIRNRLEVTKVPPQKLIAEFNVDQSELVSVRTFKLALNSLKVLT